MSVRYSDYMSVLDTDFSDISVPVTPPPITQVSIPLQPKVEIKSKYTDKTIIIIIVTILAIGVMVFLILITSGVFPSTNKSSNISGLLNKYSNMQNNIQNNIQNISQFTNKDQIEYESNNYDINYLVEQMIYKEFSPSDKKKYLNLPNALKDSLISEYLITKI